MNIHNVMSKNVEVLSPDARLNVVARAMTQRDCGCILIAKDDRLVGIITDRDLVMRAMSEGHNALTTRVADVMTKKVLYCRDTDDILKTALNMTKNKVRRLPVLDKNKRLVGIVSLGDLAANSEDYNICGKALGHICTVAKEVNFVLA